MTTMSREEEKRYQVPEGMLDAAVNMKYGSSREQARISLEAALKWLSENPIVPTDEQAKELWRTSGAAGEINQAKAAAICAVAWQQRMFLRSSDYPILDFLAWAEVNFSDMHESRREELKDNFRKIFKRGRHWGPE